MRAGLTLIVLALAAACTFELGFEGTNYRCGVGERCPEGQICIGGVCTGAHDARDPNEPDGSSGAVCGNLSHLRDTFDEAGELPFWERFVVSGAMLSETGGELVIALPAGIAANAGYTSWFFYDLHGGALNVQVDEVAGDTTLIEVRNHLDNSARLVLDDGMMVAATFNHAGAGIHAMAPRVPAESHWRIREDGGTMVWETSADRVSWRELHRRPLPFDVAHVRGEVSAGGLFASPSSARFEDVNLGGSTTGFCSTDALIDDFAAGPLSPTWNGYNAPGCTIYERDGKLTVDFAGNSGNAYCGITSSHLWDLTAGDGIVVDGGSFPRVRDFSGYFQATSPRDGETRVELVVDYTDLIARSFVNGAASGARMVTFDRINQRFWRMKGVPGTVIFETAPARIGPWTEFHTFAVPWDLTAAEINLGAGNYGPIVPTTIRVAGINAE